MASTVPHHVLHCSGKVLSVLKVNEPVEWSHTGGECKNSPSQGIVVIV